MIYEVAFAICLNTTPVKDCNQRTAISWVSQAIPEAPDLALCGLSGQIATARQGQDDATTYTKIFCTPGGRPEVPNNAG